jgi:hypothetical protein
MIRSRTHARETLAFVFLMSCVVLGLARCAPAHQGVVLDVAGHSIALAQCRAEGKEAGSYVVYEQCANEADRHFMDGGAR